MVSEVASVSTCSCYLGPELAQSCHVQAFFPWPLSQMDQVRCENCHSMAMGPKKNGEGGTSWLPNTTGGSCKGLPLSSCALDPAFLRLALGILPLILAWPHQGLLCKLSPSIPGSTSTSLSLLPPYCFCLFISLYFFFSHVCVISPSNWFHHPWVPPPHSLHC